MKTENIFGKVRGRFDETKAHEITRTMPDRAVAFCAAMSDAEFAEFIERFNKMFDRPALAARYRISRQERT